MKFGFRRKLALQRKKEVIKETRDPQEYPVIHRSHCPSPVKPPSSPQTREAYNYSFDDDDDDDGENDDDDSVDMSLYTTPSKATVRYPPELLNYGMEQDGYEDSHDGMSCAPSEFTTEIAMKRYARLGGAWRPYQNHTFSDVDSTSTTSDWTILDQPLQRAAEGRPTTKQGKEEEAEEDKEEDSDSDDDDHDDHDDSAGDSSDDSQDEEEKDEEESAAVDSVLPATAKMARLSPTNTNSPTNTTGVRDTPYNNKSPNSSNSNKTMPAPLIVRKTVSLDSEEPPVIVIPHSRGPVDLDDSFADSESIRSSGTSLLDSPRRNHPLAMTSYDLPTREEASKRMEPLTRNGRTITIEADEPSFPRIRKERGHGPVDLDESVADSVSVHSSYSTILMDSSTRIDEFRESLNSVSFEPIPKTPSKTGRNKKLLKMTEDEASDVSASRGLSVDVEDTSKDDGGDDDGSLTFSPSPANESTTKDDDDDTYGFSIVSESKSANTGKSGDSSKRAADQQPSILEARYESENDDSSKRPTEERKGLEARSEPENDDSVFTSGASNYFLSELQAKRFDESMQYSIDSTRTRQVSPLHLTKTVDPLLVNKLVSATHSLDTSMSLSLSKSRSDPRGSPDASTDSGTSLSGPSSSASRLPRSDWASKTKPTSPPASKLRSKSKSPPTLKGEPRSSPPTTNALKNHDQAKTQLKPKSIHDTSMVVEPDCGQSVVSALTTSVVADRLDDDTLGHSVASSAIPKRTIYDPLRIHDSSILVDDDEPVVWTDQREDERHATSVAKQEVRDDVLDRTYQETMDTITFARRSHESFQLGSDDNIEVGRETPEKGEQEVCTGSLRLTPLELRKHLRKVQYAQPLPSTEIQGYDSWKLEMEQKHMYFAKIQARAAREELSKRKESSQVKRHPSPMSQRPTHPRRLVQDRSPVRAIDSTRSAMESSMSSTIPTIDDRKLNSRQKKNTASKPAGWGWFRSDRKATGVGAKKKNITMTRTSKSKNTSSLSTEETKNPNSSRRTTDATKILPLSQFMRISADKQENVPSYLRGHALKVERNLAVAKPRHDEEYRLGTSQLVESLLEDQRQNRLNQKQTKETEQQRITRIRREVLEKQRRLRQIELQQKAQLETTNKAPVPSRVGAVKQSVSSSSSSDSTNKLFAPCVICKVAERDHIAMPCMHFSFCEECAKVASRVVRPTCPVCSTRDVTFRRVFTG